MQRRDFLALCTAPAVAAGGGAQAFGAVGLAPSFPLPPPPDMDGYLARVDAGLERIGRSSAFAAPAASDAAASDTLVRASLQAIFLTGMLGDLPVERQLDPGMQDRIFRSLPLFDEVSDGMSGFLASRTQQDFDRVQAALREPGASDRLIAALDAEAELTGVSGPRRAQTRQHLRHVTWRLANQPPALIVDEYLRKVEKVAATDVQSEARQRRLAARVGEKAFWSLQEQAGGPAAAAPAKGNSKRGRGAKILGIGLLLFAAGAAAASVSDAGFAVGSGLVVGTAGVIMILVGIVMLLASLGKPDAAPPESKPAEPSAAKP